MSDITYRIREEAGKLLENGSVECILGYEKGSTLLVSTPCFVRDKADVEKLIWDSFCANNLSRYLIKAKGKTAIIAKGCDTRAIVELIKEKQVGREQIIIIGAPCDGMINGKSVLTLCREKKITRIEDQGCHIVIAGDSFNEIVNKDAFLHASCKTCTHRNPVMYDVLLDNPKEEQRADDYNDVTRFNEKCSGARWDYIIKEINKCIRCYACRNSCPLCYCKDCFVDSAQPQWVGKTTGESDTLVFHIMRSFHLAGRCIECGACERACPMAVDIRKLNRKMSADVTNIFGYKAGLDMDQLTPLSTFKPDDTEEFMLDI